MAKFCKNCGAKLEDGSVFCEQCGTKFGDSKPLNMNYNPFNLYNIDMIAGENVIRHSEIHPGCLVAPGIVMGIGVLFSFITLIGMFSSYYSSPTFFGVILVFVFNPLFIIGLIWLIIRYMAYSNTDLILTTKRVFGKCGLISTTQMQSPLSMINSVSFSNGIMGKLLGYGTVRISTASVQFKFRFIRDGQTLYNYIFNHLEIAEKEKMAENAQAIADAIGRKIE